MIECGENIYSILFIRLNSDLTLTPQNVSDIHVVSAAVEYKQKLTRTSAVAPTYPNMVHRVFSRSIRNRTWILQTTGQATRPR